MTILDAPALPLSPPVNLRDLAGTPVAGGVVRPGFAVRADDLSIITADDAAALVQGGLRAVIDLRSTDEVRLTGRGPLGEHAEVTYHHVPFFARIGEAGPQASSAGSVPPPSAASSSGTSSDDDGAAGRGMPTPFHQPSYGPMYVRIVEQAAPGIVQALAIIAHSPGAVAFHCAAGQDRTGVLAAVLLLVLGADRDAVVHDYARTGPNSGAIQRRIAPVMAPLMARLGVRLDPSAQAALRADFSDAPIREMLDTLTARHGDPLVPLRAAGLTADLVATLRRRALAA